MKTKLETLADLLDMPADHIREAAEAIKRSKYRNIGQATPDAPEREWACNRCMTSWDGPVLCPYCNNQATHGRAYAQA